MCLSLIKDNNSDVFILSCSNNTEVQKINDFLFDISKESKTVETRKRNANSMKAFFEFLTSSNVSYKDVDKNIIISFKEFLSSSTGMDLRTKRSTKSINNTLATVKKFYYFLDRDLITNSMLNSLGEDSKKRKDSSIFKVKEAFKESTTINIDEAKELVSTFSNWRDVLIFKLLYLTGISITDVLKLKINDIILAVGCENEIRKKKTNGTYLKVYLKEPLLRELIKYIDEERVKFGNENDYLFVNQSKPYVGKPISYRAIHHSFAIAKEKIGLDFGFNDVRKSYFENLVKYDDIDLD